MDLTPAEQLMYATIRLESDLGNGNVVTGTGFFFYYQDSIPVIITNKHVIKGGKTGSFVFTQRDGRGLPIRKKHQRVVCDEFESRWIMHPDQDVDLAAFPIAPILHRMQAEQKNTFFQYLDETLIPDSETLSGLLGVEDIVMIGYPNGLWDEANNMPIIRRGITATNPKLDYNGRPIFLIDCACFPGSSGSPVLIYNPSGHTDASGTLHLGGQRLFLLGVLYAGPQHVVNGEVSVVDAPYAQVPIAQMKIPNNLGFVIKAEKILDFLPILLKIEGQ